MERVVEFASLEKRARAQVDSKGSCADRVSHPKEICLIPDSTIAGTRHVQGIAEIAEALSLDDAVFFKRDKRNFFDEWAVAVYDKEGRRLGYLSCEHNEIVSRLIDGGKSLFGRLVRKGQRDAWTKLEIQVILHD